MSVSVLMLSKRSIRPQVSTGTISKPKVRNVAWQQIRSLRIGSLAGISRVGSVHQRSCVCIRKRCNVVDGAVARLEIVGDLGAGARRTGLNAAFGRRDEAVTGASVRAVRQAFEVCVVSGGRGLLEAASPAVVPFDLDVPFRQDAEETQRVDESAAAW